MKLSSIVSGCRNRQGWLVVAMLLLAAVKALAVIEIAPLSNEELEARYRVLIEELRCPKCQNQNLADSNSPIAADLRAQIRTLLEEGKSDEEIVTYLVHRYGEFVRYRPAVKKDTLVLWFAPAVIFVLALVVALAVIRGYRRRPAAEAPLSDEEKQRLDQLVADAGDKGDKSR